MKRQTRPTLHLFADRLGAEKTKLEALAAELKPGLERDELLIKIRQLETAAHIDQVDFVARFEGPE
jgi:hypothetical protein